MCLNTTRACLLGMFASNLTLKDIEFTQAELDKVKKEVEMSVDKQLYFNRFDATSTLRFNQYDYLKLCREEDENRRLSEFQISAEDQRLPLFVEMSDKVVLKDRLEKEIEDFKRSIKEIYGKSIVH